ncbi:hypothetical protein SKAU_G00257710 [Synaphobranchus kaupii]|uniref:Uncharacterized protein n=1 Tax=Synaphobranchus kaupii TaxID=118154 RepID=A0A9Q1F469_SYNKA|nr:hypothetical protein SKAU_G00257710 [Synaphobranchus kaupii]
MQPLSELPVACQSSIGLRAMQRGSLTYRNAQLMFLSSHHLARQPYLKLRQMGVFTFDSHNEIIPDSNMMRYKFQRICQVGLRERHIFTSGAIKLPVVSQDLSHWIRHEVGGAAAPQEKSEVSGPLCPGEAHLHHRLTITF